MALASLLVYPDLGDIRRAFPYVEPRLIGHDMAYPAMLRFLPAGFLGLMLAGMLAAYRSTIETHLNWGTSYLVHDFYRRFLRPGASERHYVFVGRLVTALLMLCAALLTFALETAKESFDLILSVGAGTGLIYLLRWFWWRINAWSEVAAMASSFLVAVGILRRPEGGAPRRAARRAVRPPSRRRPLVWLAVDLCDAAHRAGAPALLLPAGPPGRARLARDPRRGRGGFVPRLAFRRCLLGWVLGCVFVYAALFGAGSALYGRTAPAILCLALFAGSGIGLARLLPRLWGASKA